MIKNKDGSYNTFRLVIASLIFIILISIIGIYIIQNVQFPQVENTPIVITPTPTLIPIDPEISELYNGNTSNISWNWTYTNFTNVTNWTPPQEFITNTHNITFVAGGGGGSSGTFSTNGSYLIVAGGGGSGGMGYTGIVYTNSTYIPNTTISIEPTPETTYNISQNMTAALGSISIFGITNPWLIILLIIFPIIILFSNKEISTIPVMFICIIMGIFLKLEIWTIIGLMIVIPFILNLFSD